MDAQAWSIRYSPGMPAHPSPRETGGWYFDIPSAPGSVHYVTAAVDMIATKSVSASIEITTTGTPTFEYALEVNNTCVSPARVRFLLQQKGDDLSGAGGKQYYRWWSIYAAYKLAPGSTTLTVQVSDLSQWLSVFGERADASADATAGFWQAMNNLGAVGFSFGGLLLWSWCSRERWRREVRRNQLCSLVVSLFGNTISVWFTDMSASG